MPIYEYQCDGCGRFSALRRLADYAEPTPCPACGRTSPRTVSRPAWLGPSERQRRYDGASASLNSWAGASANAFAAGPHVYGCACCRPISLTPAIGTDAGARDDAD